MDQIADLELSIYRLEKDTYAVDFRYNDGVSQADVGLGAGVQPLVTFPFDRLNALLMEGSYDLYSQELTDAFFKDAVLKKKFGEVLASSLKSGCLRIRLSIAANALELHPLRWELLANPDDDNNQPANPGDNNQPARPGRRQRLATQQSIFLTRYLSSQDWRTVRLRSRGELKALAVIAAPNNLDKYSSLGLDKVVPEDEIAVIQGALNDISLTCLEHGTLNGMLTALSSAEYDILYLVAHGTFQDSEAYVWMENDKGAAERIKGVELVNRLRELENRPRLVVLTSCQSAGKGEGQILSSLGPRMAEVGIPAVLAMQDNLSYKTAGTFMAAFFQALQGDGQIDRAMAVARSLTQDRSDWWVPALFMRLKSGRIWFDPGFADPADFEKFPTLVQNLTNKSLTPILGPGLVESLLGSPQQIARNWAETYRYPMAPFERESLPQVAQYLSIAQQKVFPYQDLMGSLRKRLQKRFKKELEALDEELLERDAAPSDVLEAASKIQLELDPKDPHRSLAKLPVDVYLTANPDKLLEAALRAAGKDPQTRVCPWNAYTIAKESAIPATEVYTKKRPLVYHMFGLWEDQETLVLTEDNYFDYLLGMALNKDLIPAQAKLAMTNKGLLFLGFQTNEWQFRVLFRAILSLPGQRQNNYANIAAQIEPEDGRIVDPRRARKYLSDYFSEGYSLKLSVYWGTPTDFVNDLMTEWEKDEV